MGVAELLYTNVSDLNDCIYDVEVQIRHAPTVTMEVGLKKKINQLITKRGDYVDIANRFGVVVPSLRELNFTQCQIQ